MSGMTRRQALAGVTAMMAAPSSSASGGGSGRQKLPIGRLKQSVCRWPHAKLPLPEFCLAVADIGLTAMDLLTEAEWPVAHDHGLPCSMGSGFGGTIADGLNVKANHDTIVESLERGIPPVIQPQEVYDSLSSGGLSGYPTFGQASSPAAPGHPPTHDSRTRHPI
jgi:hypothetical protein